MYPGWNGHGFFVMRVSQRVRKGNIPVSERHALQRQEAFEALLLNACRRILSVQSDILALESVVNLFFRSRWASNDSTAAASSPVMSVIASTDIF